MKFARKLLNQFKNPSGSGKSEDVANVGEGVADPPPAYEPHETQAESTPSSKDQGLVASTPEDPYAFLSFFDTVFLIDDSGSMAGSSWLEVRLALQAITRICVAHDADGIDLYFLNNKTKDKGNEDQGKASSGIRKIKKSENVGKIFDTVRPRGATFTGQRLRHILKPYLELLERNKDDVESVKPVNIIIITDGAPSDDVKSTTMPAAKHLDKLDAPMHQLGVQFFQVGDEPGAAKALRELDEEHEGFRDIVDTVTWKDGELGKLDAS
ncbi:hypothetical protein KNSL1_013476 [Colletotrichum chrysophilum]|nr:hypothetical protein KNSL1_013476 [Colletotrichum chrysophilum]